MTDPAIIFDPAAMRGLLASEKTQARRLATSPLRECRPGDRVWVKEACLGARLDDESREISAPMREAEFAILVDGWRQYRDGRARAGHPPTNPNLAWIPAIHMPRWASRATLVIESVRTEPLRDISRQDLRAEGLRPVLGGLAWRWHRPVRGLWRDPLRAYAALWDTAHGTSGERWDDNPDILVLGFRLEASRPGDPARRRPAAFGP